MRLARCSRFPVAVLLAGLGPLSSAGLRAQEAPPPVSTAAPSATSRLVKRSVLPDGTVQLDYADGTTRRLAPTPSSASPADKPAAAGTATSAEQIEPTAPPAWLTDAATNEAFLQAMGEYYSYKTSGLRHRRRVFEWQLLSSKVIFVTVLMLVASGIAFAAVQFRAGLKRRNGDAKDVATELDVSTAGIKVTSPVLGVIILVISLAFFYLYLVYVYPISELV